MNYNTEQLLLSLRGKIAVIGNGTPKRAFGELIDTYDHVIRINNYRTNGFEPLVGSKTTLRCTTGWKDIEPRPGVTEFSPFRRDALESVALSEYEASRQTKVITPCMDIHDWTKITKPSTGFALLTLLHKLGVTVDVFGFDGFATPHYWQKEKQYTTHSSQEFQALLQFTNVIVFGQTYDYETLYNFCHTHHSDYNENVGLRLVQHVGKVFNNSRILEFGAGNGDLASALVKQGCTVTAVEVSKEAAQKIKCQHVIQGDAFTLATLQGPFDYFVSVDVFEHLTENDIRLAIREASRLAENLFLSVSTRPSGLLGPNRENLHLTVKEEAWWRRQVSEFFELTRVSPGYGKGQLVLEGHRKHMHPLPLLPNSYCIKEGYTARNQPEYFVDTQAENVVWQPQVYSLAAQLARITESTRIIDVGCGRAQKLIKLSPEFHIMGIDFGPNLQFCRSQYPQETWVEANLEDANSLPLPSNTATESIIVCADVIEHLINPNNLMSKLRTLLRDAPLAIITTPERELTHGKEHSGPPPNVCHTREWSLHEFEQYAQQFGLPVIYAGLTQSHSKDPAKNTILLIVGNLYGEHRLRTQIQRLLQPSWFQSLLLQFRALRK